MKIHEYQAKELFRKHRIPVPAGAVAFSAAEACRVAEGLAGFPVIVKAQIHAGGRGKGGGIKTACSRTEVKGMADRLLGHPLVTPQTGPEGKVIKKILVEQGVKIARELYLSILPDRSTAEIVIMASAGGGMDIEEVAATTPEKITRVAVNPLTGIKPRHIRAITDEIGLAHDITEKLAPIISRLYTFFVEHDCSLVEINPLAITPAGEIIALDAKIEVDDNALYRQPEIRSLRDPDQEDPLEVEAARANLNYIRLTGRVATMVNGAGLAMATMDLIKKIGAEPANFLDVGGGADSEMIASGFKLMLADPRVEVVLINIFGGILRCDVLAKGIVKAARATNLDLPVVIRLAGTNVEQGRKILADSGLGFTLAADLVEATTKLKKFLTQ